MRQFFTLVCACLFVFSGKAQFSYEFYTYNTANGNALSFTGNNFKAVGIGVKNQIWAGTQYQGLYKFDDSLKVWVKSSQLTNVFINDIKRDANGGIWIGQSGTSGTVGGGSNTAGGVNYFPNEYDTDMKFYSVLGTTTDAALASRNVRSIFIDTVLVPNPSHYLPRLWVAQATYITSNNTAAGSISQGINSVPYYFGNLYAGLQVFPNVIQQQAGTPSCDAVTGDKQEVWVAARQNFGRSQILRYKPLMANGGFIGPYDNTNVPQLPSGFRVNALFTDNDGRRWVGLNFGGMLVFKNNEWKTLNFPNIFPAGVVINNNAIATDEFGYVYIGTSAGLVVFNNGAEADEEIAYQRLTTADGLPSNNITGCVYDKKNGRMVLTSDNGVTFMRVKYKIKTTMEWDNSFPSKKGNPYGVAADGVSRIYLKIRKGSDTLPQIKSVKVSIHDFQAGQETVRGSLKTAGYLEAQGGFYTDEANVGTSREVSRTDANNVASDESFWFWYVAPEDFSRDSSGSFAQLAKRYDSVKIVMEYVNNTKDSVVFKIAIVRPPLVLVHGLASSPGAWANFKHNYGATPYVESKLFKYKRALTMDGRAAFYTNAELMMGGDQAIGAKDGRLSSLQGNIEEMRNLGFAANQVDYICHSMGGIMIRASIQYFPEKYRANSSSFMYNNYGKGFVHKLITINTPHNGSPLGDMIQEYIPLAPGIANYFLNRHFKNSPESQIPFDFIVPDPASNNTTFRASGAVSNLAVSTRNGGKKLPATQIRHAMIAGDIDWYSDATAANLVTYEEYIRFANYAWEFARNVTPQPFRSELDAMMLLANGPRVLSFLEWISARKNFPNFLGDGDIIVPLMSQTARQPVTQSNIRVFKNSGATFAGITLPDAWHSVGGILDRPDVGQHALNLLNMPLKDNVLFADVIPANTDPEPAFKLNGKGTAGTEAAPTSTYDTSRIVVYSPARSGTLHADSTINVQYRVKNTTNLKFVKLLFQNTDSLVVSNSTALRTVSMKISPEYSGSQLLWAIAVYEQPNGDVNYYADTVAVNVDNLGTLQNFRIINSDEDIMIGNEFFPKMLVTYSGRENRLANTDPAVQVSFIPDGIVTYDVNTNAFKGVVEGGATAVIQYKGFRDSIRFNSIMPIFGNCVNKTVAAGNLKNPAIWSKGFVPGPCDSLVIDHAITADTLLTASKIRIGAGGSLTINNAAYGIKLGEPDKNNAVVDNYGTLTLNTGALTVYGRVKMNAGSTFTMSGGMFRIDGNTSLDETSVANGFALFEAAPGMASFSFTGGTLQLVDPPLGAASQAINCGYNFGNATTLILGDGTSTVTSNNVNGFGGNLWPDRIGKLVVNGVTQTGNRHFITKKPLVTKGVEVKAGSKVVQEALLRVEQ